MEARHGKPTGSQSIRYAERRSRLLRSANVALLDSATEELGHLKVIGAIVAMHNKGVKA